MLHPKEKAGVVKYDEDINTDECVTLVFGAWNECWNNKGRGGTMTSGCLAYSTWIDEGHDGNVFDLE